MGYSEHAKEYWNGIAGQPDVNWHIAHIDDEAAFIASGIKTAKKMFGENLELLPESGCVLEIGCGRGRVLRYLAEQRPDLFFYGVDVSEVMIAKAYKAGNVAYVVCNGVGLPDYWDEFDLIYSYAVFQHMPEASAKSYIADSARVLKDGGKFIFQMQTGMPTKNIDADNCRTVRCYTIDEIRALIVNPLRLERTFGSDYSTDFIVFAYKKSEKGVDYGAQESTGPAI